MIPQRLLVSIVLSAGILVSAASHAADYKIDPSHSNALFSIRHLVSKVNGEFKDLNGTISFDAKKPTEAKISATVKAANINTNNEKRDEHLRSDDFFAAEKNPELKFTSTKITPAGKNKYKMTGDLTMRGVTKPVTFDVEYLGEGKGMMGETRAGFAAKSKVNRKDYGINWNKTLDAGGVVLGDEVEITLNVEAVKEETKK